jgi:hypothetical protein
VTAAAPWAPRLLRVALALVLCLQSTLALAHCLRAVAAPAHAAFHVEICTAEGILVVDLGGAAEGGEAPAGTDHAGFCLACHGLPQLLLPQVPVATLPAARPAPPPFAAARALPPLGARAPPYASRAPPSLS